jgi:modulator of FtsH protease
MTEQTTTYGRFGTAVSAQQRNKVLRNTYWLLALSMLPTVLGAWVGVATGITASLSGGVGLIVFLGGAFGFMFAIEKTKNSAAGVPVLLAFTFFMGLMLSRLLAMVLGFSNGASLIMTAFGGTAGVFFVMANLSTIVKRDLEGLSKWLFMGAIVLLIGGIINVFVGSPIGMAVLSVMAIGIFSAFLLVDLKRIVDGGETNYITATLALYLSLFNIFQSLLMLLGLFRRRPRVSRGFHRTLDHPPDSSACRSIAGALRSPCAFAAMLCHSHSWPSHGQVVRQMTENEPWPILLSP